MATLILRNEVVIRLPAEWALQRAVMLTWPHQYSIWAPSLAAIDRTFVAMAKAVTEYQELLITSYDKNHQQHITDLLQAAHVNLNHVSFFQVPSNDVWVRDHGPITVIQDHKAVHYDFSFNGWGGKYPSDKDNAVNQNLAKQNAFADAAVESINFVLEGGSIDVDGEGTLLTTESCLLAKTRNPTLSREQIETQLKDLFGVERILWLKHGAMAGDDTDGHIDTLARFTDPETICHLACDDPNDQHYSDLQAMRAELAAFKTVTGKPYRLVPLPWPAAIFKENGQRLPNTYANFLIINHAVLVPTYRDPKDALALATIQQCFPDRKIIGIDCRDLINQYGSLHCVTMQIPAVE